MEEPKYIPVPTGANVPELTCNCKEGDEQHRAYVDKNGEVVVECSVCERFRKLPKEFAPKE